MLSKKYPDVTDVTMQVCRPRIAKTLDSQRTAETVRWGKS